MNFFQKFKVGIIQGDKADVEGKDIVIGMLQSVSMHIYPNYVFDDFGLAIYDECHHLCAYFQRRYVNHFKYTLGLSATPNRKMDLLRYLVFG